MYVSLHRKLALARRLRRLANRLDPSPPLVYEVDSCMTEATAKLIGETLSWQHEGLIGVSYVRPDGERMRV